MTVTLDRRADLTLEAAKRVAWGGESLVLGEAARRKIEAARRDFLALIEREDITIYGDGLQTRSFCYIDDLVEGMIRLMDSGDDVTGPINIGNPGEFTMIQLAETVLKLVGSKSKLVRLPLPADDPKQRKPDITKARSVLGWEPKVHLEDGLKETIAYFRTVLSSGEQCA